MSVCWPIKVSSEELGNRLQTPTLIGCKFLRIFDSLRNSLGLLRLSCLAVISEALNYSMNFFMLKTFCVFFKAIAVALKKTPPHVRGRFLLLRAWRCPTFTRESALSSAQRRFTVLFGMGRSGTTSLWSSGKTFCHLGLVKSLKISIQSRQPIYRVNQLHRLVDLSP